MDVQYRDIKEKDNNETKQIKKDWQGVERKGLKQYMAH